MERRLADILAADMVGYSRFMAADETGTLTRQKTHLTELIDPKIKKTAGACSKPPAMVCWLSFLVPMALFV